MAIDDPSFPAMIPDASTRAQQAETLTRLARLLESFKTGVLKIECGEPNVSALDAGAAALRAAPQTCESCKHSHVPLHELRMCERPDSPVMLVPDSFGCIFHTPASAERSAP